MNQTEAVMEISIISFTERGEKLAERVADRLRGKHTCSLYTKRQRFRSDRAVSEEANKLLSDRAVSEDGNKLSSDRGGSEDADSAGQSMKMNYVSDSLTDWAGKQFQMHNALLFIGACGIAVRSIAPFVRDKLTDSPVLVMEETGQYVIPLLSGHYGGANALARQIAKKMGAIPVITTATDVNHLFAVDVFAAENDLWISGHEGIARVSAGLVERMTVTMSLAGDWEGDMPQEIIRYPYPPMENVDVLVAVKRPEHVQVKLQLVPKSIALGIGCKKGKAECEIERFVLEQLALLRIPVQAVGVLATIDRKGGEEGLLAFAAKYGMDFEIYTKEELAETEGAFSGSRFVAEQVGVDNVCERAAIRSAGVGGKLLLKKTAQEGMTLAVAEKRWSVRYDET